MGHHAFHLLAAFDLILDLAAIVPIDQTEGFSLRQNVVQFILQSQRVRMRKVKTNQLKVLPRLALWVNVAGVLDEEVASLKFGIALTELLFLAVPREGAHHAASLNKVLILLHLIHVDSTLEAEKSGGELELGPKPEPIVTAIEIKLFNKVWCQEQLLCLIFLRVRRLRLADKNLNVLHVSRITQRFNHILMVTR